jgi:hypothetical protein
LDKILTKEQAARLKAIKAAAEKLKAERKLATRRRIEELHNAKLPDSAS